MAISVAHVVGPGAVVSAPRTRLEPDLLAFPSSFSPSLSWADITGHWLAVEVLSRSSRWYDREYKRDAYFQLGVREVWLVDVEARSVDVWRSQTEHEAVRDVVHWNVPTTDRIVDIPLDAVFAGREGE